jgi:type I restriction enzyme, S subunit
MKYEHLPEGWRWVRFDEIAYNVVERNGDNPDRTVMAVTKYEGLFPSLEYFDRRVYSDDISNYKVVRPNQFAYAVIHLDEGSIGMNDSDEPVLVSPVYVVFGLDEHNADPEYFRFLLKSDYMMMTYQRIGEGTVDRRKSITFETLGSAHIPLPPRDEQRRIAEVLRDADVNIARVEEQIEAAQEVKRGMMQRLFTYGLAGEDTPTKHTRIGEIPEMWEVRRIGELTEEQRERNTTHKFDRGEVLSVSNSIGFFVSDRELPNNLSRYKLVQYQDFGYNPMRLNIGSIAFRDIPQIGLISPDYVVFRCKENLLIPEFFNQYRMSELWRSQIQQAGQGGVRIRYYYKDIARFRVPLPSLKEQCEIAAILSDHDTTIHGLRMEVANLREVKRGLMQKLLSGHIRV